MVTSGNTDLGIVNDSTWFIVFNPLVSNAQQGLFGLNSSANRFGAFYTGSTNQLRYMNFTDPDTVIQPTIPTAGVNISDSRRSGGGSVAMSGRLNGNTFANSDQTTSLNATTPVSTQFRIGNQLDGVPNNFVGDIAEVIVYNRALNDAERIIVENRLSAKYGTTLAANDLYAGKTTGNGNYDLDLIGIGDKTVTGTALNPGSVTTSEDGGGLKLAALNNSLNSDGEFLLAGRASDAANSWTAVTVGGINYARWSRDWYLDKTTADSLDAKFTFDFSLAPGASQPTSGSYALLYKSSLGGSWTDLGLAATVAGQQVSFNVLNANLSDGYYTLGMIPEPSTIFLLLCGGGLVWAWFRRGRRW